MKTFAISIPKPCHEDWNKMTPDAKGAFCGSCQKTVYDFSDKTDEEIISVFEKEEKGKVCGRFAPAQLSRPVVTFGNVSSTNRLAVFLYALLLAFGATLFSGADAFAQEVKGEMKVKVMGKMAMRPVEPVTEIVNDTLIPVKQIPNPVCGTKTIVDNRIMAVGQAVVREQPIIQKPIVQEPIIRMGESTFEEISEPKIIETIPVIEKESILTVFDPPLITEEPEMLMGDMMIEPISLIETPTIQDPENIGIDTIATVEETIIAIDTLETISPPENISYVTGGISYMEIIEEAPLLPVPSEEEIIEDKSIACELTNVPVEEKTEDKLVTAVETKSNPETEESPEVKSTLVTETIIFPSDLEVKVSPNPSNGQITLSYKLDSQMPVRIDLFDITGKFVKTLTQQGNQYAGKYNVSYNLADLQNGIYFATLLTNDRKSSAKIILTK